MKIRPVNPMSLLTDVFVELERLHRACEALRDKLTTNGERRCTELYDVRHHAYRIIKKLRVIDSLLSLQEEVESNSAPRPWPTVVK
jgi:hypothetical protein